MTELQHQRQIVPWVSVRHSVWKTPKQGQSQIPKPVARDGASSVATCWAASMQNACTGVWMEHWPNRKNSRKAKKSFKGWPHFGVQILDPKMGTRKEKMKAWPHFGVQNLDPKIGSATRVGLPAFVVWIERRLTHECFKTYFQLARSPTQTEEAPSSATGFGIWNWPCFGVWEKAWFCYRLLCAGNGLLIDTEHGLISWKKNLPPLRSSLRHGCKTMAKEGGARVNIVWKDSAQSLCVWLGAGCGLKFCRGLTASWKKNRWDFIK